jgi:PemK-like, MazF-like toxin of type II toxin-antitoxin system
MVSPAPGAVVLVRFPFAERAPIKLRPAVVVAACASGDRVLCQITSKPYGDAQAIALEAGHFAAGSLRLTSYARPGKLFTANRDLIFGSVGQLKPEIHRRIVDAVITLLNAGLGADML